MPGKINWSLNGEIRQLDRLFAHEKARKSKRTWSTRSFLEGTPLFVSSSNLDWARYYPKRRMMKVAFKNGYTYAVGHITMDEARLFAEAGSKGGWYWDVVRVRGSHTKHKKPVKRLS